MGGWTCRGRGFRVSWVGVGGVGWGVGLSPLGRLPPSTHVLGRLLSLSLPRLIYILLYSAFMGSRGPRGARRDRLGSRLPRGPPKAPPETPHSSRHPGAADAGTGRPTALRASARLQQHVHLRCLFTKPVHCLNQYCNGLTGGPWPARRAPPAWTQALGGPGPLRASPGSNARPPLYLSAPYMHYNKFNVINNTVPDSLRVLGKRGVHRQRGRRHRQAQVPQQLRQRQRPLKVDHVVLRAAVAGCGQYGRAAERSRARQRGPDGP